MPVREDVSCDPGIYLEVGDAAADGVEEEEPVVLEAAAGDVHERLVGAESDVLEHADRDHGVEALVEVAVVLEADLDRQSGGAAAPELDLLL